MVVGLICLEKDYRLPPPLITTEVPLSKAFNPQLLSCSVANRSVCGGQQKTDEDWHDYLTLSYMIIVCHV